MKLSIEDMSCEGCARSVTRAIQRLDPAAEVVVDRLGGTAEVTTAANGEALLAALAQAGYPSQILSR
ncbi:heavy-metal-associated domain-containing protein [Aureimonas sp. AU40]|uniref:heavy-metal-associated domain-containing protein n=1 Tax=Aureimonas sp. AU40 TaxID=1637747 RepID=UPI000782A312|nr:heavy-metal-associated domain-containing protein [Aureimonas sp. AU40]